MTASRAPEPVGRVFLSFATEDLATVEDLARRLEADGLPCWLAPRDVRTGEDYAEAISRAITSAPALVILLSRHSSASQHCAREVELAVREEIPLIPIRVDHHQLSGALQYRLATCQWLDLDDKDFYPRLASILRAERNEAAPDLAEPPPQARAAASARALPPSRPVAGRDRELRAAADVLARTRELGSGRLIVIRGESGVGKSALAEAIIRLAADEGYLVARSICEAFHEGMSFFPVRELMRQLSRTANLQDEVRALYGTDSAQALMAAVAETEAVEPSARRDAIIATFANIAFGRANEEGAQPVLLAIDDLERADAGTVDSLLCLMARAHDGPVTVLGTYRTDVVPATKSGHALSPLLTEAARSGDQVLWLDLKPLPQTSLPALIAAILGAECTLPSAFLQRLWQETEGNPLFVREVLRWMAGTTDGQGPSLERDGDRWVLRGDAGSWQTPATVEATIRSRLAVMEEGARDELERASVVGKRFAFEVVSRLTEAPEAELLDRLERCIELALIEESAEEIDWFQFTHGKIREVLYESMSRIRRRRIHSAVADALLALQDHVTGDWDALIGEHLYQAGRYQEAVPVLRTAARQMLALSAGADAAALLDKAIGAADRLREADAPDVADLHILRLKAYFMASEYASVTKLAEELGDRPQTPELVRGWAFDYLGDVQSMRGDREAALATYRRAEEIAVALADLDLELEVVTDLAENYIRAAEEQAGLDEDLSAQYRRLADGYLDRQNRLAESSTDPQARARALRNQAKRLRHAGDIDGAVRMYEESLRLTDPRVGTHTVLISYAKTLRFAGRIDEARRAVERVLEWSSQSGARRSLGIAHHYRAVLRIEADGPTQAALDDLECALDTHSEIGYERGLWEVRMLLGEWYALSGDRQRAVEAFRMSIKAPPDHSADDVVSTVVRQLDDIDEHRRARVLEELWRTTDG